MDNQFQELIDKLKKDGMDAASKEADCIKTQAEEEAKRIVDAARREADAITAKAKADAERTEKAGVAAIGQASRNVVLTFKTEIQGVLDKIVAQETGSSLNDETLKSVLPDILKGWAAQKGDSLDLILEEGQLKKLSSYFNDKLAAELKKGVELKPGRNLAAGFRIAGKDGSAYYDFSADSVAELLSAYLNPKLAEILKESAKGM
ncbi:MAG: V-type ATP synthase subunit E [Treponema sp.]|jgi:V/A-type H+-transporting ATPase subunit E|nr:V-type ATP synthase subunit E [Treponema sp.]